MTLVIALAGSSNEGTKFLALFLSILAGIFFIVVANEQAGSMPRFNY